MERQADLPDIEREPSDQQLEELVNVVMVDVHARRERVNDQLLVTLQGQAAEERSRFPDVENRA